MLKLSRASLVLVSTIFSVPALPLTLASVSDIQTMTIRNDGEYDVTCENGSKEIRTSEQIHNNEVCRDGGDQVEGVFSRPGKEDFFVLCKNKSWEIATEEALEKGRLCGSSGYNPEFSLIVRNADGNIRYMDQADAINYCASQGQHLPSARELAHLSERSGAAGISDVDKSSYSLVVAKNANGKVDSFYFSYSAYKQPAGDLGTKHFWSSSFYLNAPVVGYELNGDNGDVEALNRASNLAVRCVRGP